MKNILKLLLVAFAFIMILAGCNSSKYASAQHYRGVNNSHYRGY